MSDVLYYIYLTTFLVGGTLMLGQLVLSLFGIGKDHDADHDADHDVDHDHDGDHDHHHGHHAGSATAMWFLTWLTLRTLTAAATFFGLGGLAAWRQGMDWGWGLAIAAAAGFGALLLVGSLMRALHKLKADGTVHIERAVGQPAVVYLSIPAGKSGAGKVTVVVQNRTMEYRAVTPHQELPTGAKVKVTAVVSPDTVEVVST
jgi:hypothetical protein